MLHDLNAMSYAIEYKIVPYCEWLHIWLHTKLYEYFGRKYCGSWIFRKWPSRKLKSKIVSTMATEMQKEIDRDIFAICDKLYSSNG